MSGAVLRGLCALLFASAACAWAAAKHPAVEFQTSDRCIACHNGLTTVSGEDVSIGFKWRASIMANSSRDPYWQASVRREIIDHPESSDKIQDDCSICHMPVPRYLDKLQGRMGQVFSHLPFDMDKQEGREAADGVTCSVCHQVANENFGKRESFNGNFVISRPADKGRHNEYGPFNIAQGQQTIMRSSSGGFIPHEQLHIRDSELCATCHSLYTEALSPNGKVVGELPEQVPYQEWLHSEYRNRQSCQECHMPEVKEKTPIAHVLGVPREGLHRHSFVAANFLMTNLFNRHRDELQVAALPEELSSSATAIVDFLQSRSARVTVEPPQVSDGSLSTTVVVENLGGHKLPTAYPSRRAWLHVVVTDRNGAVVFESGGINPDGSIRGNDNDNDASRYERHYPEITSPEQVEIYETIMQDPQGHVTTGLLTAIGYIKDNRLLPHGFDKNTADPDVAVRGEALSDPNFNDRGSKVRYTIAVGNASGPFHVTAELCYQPIGFRWAHNLDNYRQAAETRRFGEYYSEMSSSTAVVLAKADVLSR